MPSAVYMMAIMHALLSCWAAIWAGRTDAPMIWGIAAAHLIFVGLFLHLAKRQRPYR